MTSSGTLQKSSAHSMSCPNKSIHIYRPSTGRSKFRHTASLSPRGLLALILLHFPIYNMMGGHTRYVAVVASSSCEPWNILPNTVEYTVITPRSASDSKIPARYRADSIKTHGYICIIYGNQGTTTMDVYSVETAGFKLVTHRRATYNSCVALQVRLIPSVLAVVHIAISMVENISRNNQL